MSDKVDRTHSGGFAGGLLPAAGSRRPCVLTINGGSSSLKFAVFGADGQPGRVLSGRVERVGLGDSRLVTSDAAGHRREDRSVEAPDQGSAAALVVDGGQYM